MRNFIRNASIQLQINAALSLIGLSLAASLVVAMFSADRTLSTFKTLEEENAPAIFAAFEANQSLSRINNGFEQIATSRTPEQITAADESISAAQIELSTQLAAIAGEAAQSETSTRLSAIAEARSAAVKAAAERLRASEALHAVWAKTEAVQGQLTSQLVNVTDEATFNLVLTADDAKTKLVEGVSTLINADLADMSLLTSLRAILAELEGEAFALDVVSSPGVRAATLDRLESTLGAFRGLLDDAPAGREELVAEMSRLHADAEKMKDPAGLDAFLSQGGAKELIRRKRELSKTLADLIDEASFELVVKGEDLGQSTATEVERLAEAMTGQYRATLDAMALTHEAVSRVAQAMNAPDIPMLELIHQNSGTLTARLETAASNPALEAFKGDFQALGRLLDGSDSVIAARRADLQSAEATKDAQRQVSQARAGLEELVASLAQAERESMSASMADADSVVTFSGQVQLAAGLATVLVVILVAAAFIRPRIVLPLRAFREAVARLANGEQVALPGVGRADEIGALARSMGAIYENGVAAARIRIGLDNSSALLMIADADNRISYVSEGLRTLLQARGEQIGEQIEGWDATRLDGGDLAQFDLSGDAEALQGRSEEPEHMRLALGGLLFDLSIRPVRSASAERLGTVVEWRDMTIELQIREEIDSVVSGALEGDFSGRIDAGEASGQLRIMAEKLNALVSSVDAGVGDTEAAIAALAQGRLDHNMSGAHKGAFAKLQNNVNATIEKLRSVVGAINLAARKISVRVEEMQDSALQLSGRAESQAAALQQTSATMEELASTIRSSADSAQDANGLAVGARSGAERGGEIVSEAVNSMSEIKSSSQKIGEIVGVIDSIAFQTNLLALNAAVEAARAGDAGKGFAVVAQEVRALAQRSSDASQDIRALIDQSGGQVERGVERVNAAGSALEQIVGEVKSVADRIADISRASSEQASGVDEVSESLNEMDKITQQNASMAEQSAAGAAQLASEAASLIETVGYFSMSEAASDAAAKEGAAA